MKIKYNKFFIFISSLLLFLSLDVLGVNAIAPSNLSPKVSGITDLMTNQNRKEGKKAAYLPGEVIVKYKKEAIDLMSQNGISKNDSFLQKNGLEKKDTLKNNNSVVLKIKDSKTVEEKILELEKDPNIEYVQPNYLYYPTSIATNDPSGDYLWGLENTGQAVNGVFGSYDKDIDAPEAWYRSEGAGIVIAVIDNGVAYNHPDLINNMWNGANCVNELGDALGGCSHGYDYVDNDREPLPGVYYVEGNSHGTHIAGTIAATSNNNTGIVGVAPQSKIMALRTDYSTAQIIKAINFAGKNGAKIINASWGGASADPAMLEAINNFPGLFIAAAGNGDGDTDPEGDNHDSGETLHSYPCDYTSDKIICVAATDQNDNLASFSDYGSVSVDVGAPGVNIFSTVQYKTISNETFENIQSLSLPTNWTKHGNNNYWGARSMTNILGAKSYFLMGDMYKPYSSYSSTYVVSPIYNLTGGPARFKFAAICDTPYSSFRTDYMFMNFTKDGGSSWNNGTWWDEYILYNNFSDSFRPSDYSYMVMAPEVSVDIDPVYLSNNFQFAFTWVTDGYDNNYWGCGVSYINIIQSGSNYAYEKGTSMAAPHVAGVAALVWGYRPKLSSAEVKAAILDSGDTVASLSGKTTSGKRVNANNALLAVQGEVINTFNIVDGGTNYPCTISEKLMKISCRLPGNVAKTNIAPTINLSGGSIFPESGSAINLIASNTYTFTKTDTTVESYTVNISDYFRTSTQFRSGKGNWGVLNTKYTTSGDFNGDGKDEIAAMYDYGNEDMAMIVFTPSGASFTNATWFRSGKGNWGVPFTKYLTAGDFNGDGKDEIAAMYDYGNEDMAMIMFTPNDSSFSTSTWFRSGKGNWGVPFTKYLTAGDFNGDKKDELNATYDYGNEDMAMIIFSPNGTSFTTSTWFRSGKGNWGVPFTKHISASDLNNDGKDELATMYDYGNEDMAIILFIPNVSSFSTSTWFRSGKGNWGVSNTKYLTSGDFDGDGKNELSAMYDYGNEDMAMIMFTPNDSSFSTSTWFRSGKGNWGVPFTKHISAGDYDGNGIEEVSAMYDYGNEDMAVILFR